MRTTLYVLWILLPWVSLIYTITGTWLLTYRQSWGRPAPRPWNTLWKWAKWPTLLHVFADPVLDVMFADKITVWTTLSWVCNAIVWYYLRNAGDDDLGPKVRKKLLETVSQVGGKLIIVPVRTA